MPDDYTFTDAANDYVMAEIEVRRALHAANVMEVAVVDGDVMYIAYRTGRGGCLLYKFDNAIIFADVVEKEGT